MTEETRKMLNPKRMEGETDEEYKKRRKAVSKAIKKYLKGRTLWNPNLQIPYEGKTYSAGPYVKEDHGELLSGLELGKHIDLNESRGNSKEENSESGHGEILLSESVGGGELEENSGEDAGEQFREEV